MGFGFRLRRRAPVRAADDDVYNAKTESRRYHPTTATTNNKKHESIPHNHHRAAFLHVSATNSCRLSIFRRLGEAIRSVCLSQRDVKLAPPIPKYRSLLGRRRRRRIQAIGTRLRTQVFRYGCAHPSAIYLYGSGLGGGGCWIGRHGGVRQASHPGYFPLRGRPTPLWRLLMFLCLVCGGLRFPACRAGSGVGSPDSQRVTSSQVSQFVGPPPAALSDVGDSLVCVCVTRRRRAATTNCPAGHGWRWCGGMGVYGYRALFLCCGCEAGSFEITSRGEYSVEA